MTHFSSAQDGPSLKYSPLTSGTNPRSPQGPTVTIVPSSAMAALTRPGGILGRLCFLCPGLSGAGCGHEPLDSAGPGDHGILGDHGLVQDFFLGVEGGDKQLPSKASFFWGKVPHLHISWFPITSSQGSTLDGHSRVWSQLAIGWEMDGNG